MNEPLSIMIAVIAIASVMLARNSRHENGFFLGQAADGRGPGLLTLVFSQVTTWIFARSLLNAAILGFYYGLWATLAYAAYYLSFITGGLIVDHLRFRQGYTSVQAFLAERFGRWGVGCYNSVVGVRLVSEVFANLLVIGILFGAAGSQPYVLAVLAVALVTLLYSMLGAALYFTESAGHSTILGEAHKYTKLLAISIFVLGAGCLLFWVGRLSSGRRELAIAQA